MDITSRSEEPSLRILCEKMHMVKKSGIYKTFTYIQANFYSQVLIQAQIFSFSIHPMSLPIHKKPFWSHIHIDQMHAYRVQGQNSFWSSLVLPLPSPGLGVQLRIAIQSLMIADISFKHFHYTENWLQINNLIPNITYFLDLILLHLSLPSPTIS